MSCQSRDQAPGDPSIKNVGSSQNVSAPAVWVERPLVAFTGIVSLCSKFKFQAAPSLLWLSLVQKSVLHTWDSSSQQGL